MAKQHAYYKDNPNLKLKKVQVFNGDTEYKVHCIMYKNVYLQKHIHCIEAGAGLWDLNPEWKRKFQIMDDLGILPPGDPEKWARQADGMGIELQPAPIPDKEVFDHEVGKKVKYVGSMVNGVVAFNGDKLEMGYYTPNPLKNAKAYFSQKGGICNVISYQLLEQNGYILGTSDGTYYDQKKLDAAQLKEIKRKCIKVNLGRNVYNVVDDNNTFDRAIKTYNDSTFHIDKDIKYISKYIKNFTFGVEFEAINGMLPAHILAQYGVIVCKDGSLRDDNGNYPPEYVTVPLQGAKGLQTLRNLCKELQKHSDIDNKCSLHIHLGGFEMDRTFMVSLYSLCYKIQDQIFDIFPYYKRDEVKYANKQKNYCKMLPNVIMNYGSGNFKHYVDSSYNNIYKFLSGGCEPGPNNNFARRANPWGGNKWDIKSRYYWLNLTNIAFGKQQTVEFRIHTPTFNFDKLIAWLLMCTSTIEYAKNNIMECTGKEPVSFRNDVLSYYNTVSSSSYSSFFVSNLQAYYDYRRDYFEVLRKKRDYIAKGEIDEDFGFNFNIIKLP